MVQPIQDDEPLLRYMSFAKFVWMLQNKALWLARIDLLGDPWELQYLMGAIALETVPVGADGGGHSGPMGRLQQVYDAWTSMTFISCWTRDARESHALWSIYCPSSEGVAIQTTVARLKNLEAVNIFPVDYEPIVTPGEDAEITLTRCATTKKPWYDYEHEARLLLKAEGLSHLGPIGGPFGFPSGIPTAWDLEANLDAIIVHPLAQSPFEDTVRDTIKQYAPALMEKVKWSEMRTPPPFTKTRDVVHR